MNFETFNRRRRQNLLTVEMYDATRRNDENILAGAQFQIQKSPPDSLRKVARIFCVFQVQLDQIRLEYTAGASIESLREKFRICVSTYENFGQTFVEWHILNFPDDKNINYRNNLELADLNDYHQLISLISIGLLLGDHESIARIHKWHSTEETNDSLLKLLLDLPSHDFNSDSNLIHDDFYHILFESKSNENRERCILKFLATWYAAFEGSPWYDQHLNLGKFPDDYYLTNFYGYWAFEAAALTVLWNLDDSNYRNHPLYPKDFADYARTHHA